MGATDNYPQVEITSRAQWRGWLQKHHASSTGIWLVTHKKSQGDKHVPYADVVEEALCFGWIDSVGRKMDSERSGLLLTPRKARSGWSAVNKTRIKKLEAAGLMTEIGAEKIREAKANGTWTKLDASDAMTEPDDLKKAFTKSKVARKNWDAFPASARKATLEWIYAAKRNETRATRVQETVKLSAENIRPRQWIPKEK